MRVLGIETSCDDTGVALYDSHHGLVAHAVRGQVTTHAPFGGVVPELASRDHIKRLAPMVVSLLEEAGTSLSALDGIAYTKGPGLVGALLVGATLGQTLGFALDIPTIGVNHLEGHLLSPFIGDPAPPFPFLALLISGGHTMLVRATDWGVYEILGETLDDAAGEAFDKTAKLLGLGYPGGAALSALAAKGRPHVFYFPRPMVAKPGLDFSFSGLKTHASTMIEKHPDDAQAKADIAYAFEEAAVETLVVKCKRALTLVPASRLVVVGGVSANLSLRKALAALCGTLSVELIYPAHEFCTDNGAMIAYVGTLRLSRGEREGLLIEVQARWPL